MLEGFIKQVWVLRPGLWQIGLLRWWTVQEAGLLSLWNLLRSLSEYQPCLSPEVLFWAFLAAHCFIHSSVNVRVEGLLLNWPRASEKWMWASQPLGSSLLSSHFVRITLPKHSSCGEQMLLSPASSNKLGSSLLVIRNELGYSVHESRGPFTDTRWEKQTWVTFTEFVSKFGSLTWMLAFVLDS